VDNGIGDLQRLARGHDVPQSGQAAAGRHGGPGQLLESDEREEETLDPPPFEVIEELFRVPPGLVRDQVKAPAAAERAEEFLKRDVEREGRKLQRPGRATGELGPLPSE